MLYVNKSSMWADVWVRLDPDRAMCLSDTYFVFGHIEKLSDSDFNKVTYEVIEA